MLLKSDFNTNRYIIISSISIRNEFQLLNHQEFGLMPTTYASPQNEIWGFCATRQW